MSDRRKEFELLKFTAGEISSAINVFGKQLGEQVNPILKRYLTEQCQGYPWLLKKLCIHVHSLITNGINQGDIIGQRLSINDLFEKDLNELTPSEAGCITEVAKESPADFFKVTEVYGNDTVQLLINKRLLIRSASKLILYWDIFRDYVLYKTVPPIVLSYIPSMQYNTIMKIVSVLLKNNNITSDQLAYETGLKKSTIDNAMIDMVMFGIAQRKKDNISLMMDTKQNILECLSDIFKNHLIYKLMQQSVINTFNYEIYSSIFMATYAQGNLKKKTILYYSAKLFNWFRELNLFLEVGAEYSLNENFDMEKMGQEIKGYKRRRGRNNQDALFLGQTSPDKVAKAIELIKNGITSRNELKIMGLRNALEVLSSLSLIKINNDLVTLYGTYADVIEQASLSSTIKSCLEFLSDNPQLKSKELGELIERRLSRKWTDTSKKRYGAALLLWCRYLMSLKKCS